MKITKAHYDEILTEIGKLNPLSVSAYRKELKTDSRIKDIEKRLRWDLLYATVKSSWIYTNLYPYLDDTHIDTALRSIVRELGLAS